jgi:pimeloyl-ACP methyl ester carboxylesterase
VLGIERARWLGHDWGAFAGWHATTENPERFERFMPMAVPHPWPPEEWPGLRRLARLWYQVVLGAPLLGRVAVAAGFPRQILKVARKAGEWSDDELSYYGDLVRRPGYVHATQQYYRSFLLREMLPLARGQFNDRRLTVPTRLVAGASDALLEGMGEEYRDHADDMEVVRIDGAAHWLPEEKPEAVLEIALGFLP